MTSPFVPIKLRKCWHSSFSPADFGFYQELKEISLRLQRDPLVGAFFQSVPGFALILDRKSQVVYANERFIRGLGFPELEPLIGLRVGNAFQCVHVEESPFGCGTAEACTTCGAGTAVFESQTTGQTMTRECHFSVPQELGGALDFEAIATPFEYEGRELTILTLRDVSGELRRRVLERVFFHDVLNTAGGLQGLARILWEDANGEEDSEEAWVRKSVFDLSNQLVNDIQSQRAIAAAEAGELQVDPMDIDPIELIESAVSVVSGHEVCEGRSISFQRSVLPSLVSDPHLLQRVLVNLIKNAVEATPEGGTVTVWGELEGNARLCFTVHNPTVMPREVQLQIFHRSFSTKEGSGRGIGTYSVKLLGENYLGGEVSFTSAEPHGTLFRLTLPLE